jgi:hypothetical protein
VDRLKKMNKRVIISSVAGLFVIILIVILLANCAKTDDTTVDAEMPAVEEPIDSAAAFAPEETVDKGTSEPEVNLPYTYPLTGKPAAENMKDRPFVVMVENYLTARPQSGLDQADLVYEVLAEGNITRFVAVYHSQPAEAIGPVRSIRPYFIELGLGFDGILVHAGWSQVAMNLIAEQKLNHLDQVYGDHPYFWRDKARASPHNVFTSTKLMKKGVSAKKFRKKWVDPELRFTQVKPQDGTRPAEGQPATSITIPYVQSYAVGYDYQASSNTYLRSMDGTPHVDRISDKVLSATNVLIIEAKHRVVDDDGRRSVDVYGPGRGYLLQNGLIRRIIWENRNDVIRAYEPSGKQAEIPLFPGQTWVQIIPKLEQVSYAYRAAAE